MSLAENLKTARKRLGLTQKELAERVGISPNSIVNYENNRRSDPPLSIAMKIADALGTSVENMAKGRNVLECGDRQVPHDRENPRG